MHVSEILNYIYQIIYMLIALYSSIDFQVFYMEKYQ